MTRRRASARVTKSSAAASAKVTDRTGSRPAAASRVVLFLMFIPALAAAATFANTMGNDLLYDDPLKIESLAESNTSWWVYFLPGQRGLTHAVHVIDNWLWGSWAPGWHLTNLVLHSLASALAAYAALALTQSRRVALLCGLLFAVHPVHVEAVASITNRKDILAMIFVMLALISWLGPHRRLLRYAGSLLCLGLAILSKEVAAVALVPMLFFADLLPGYGHPAQWLFRLRRAMWRSVPFLGVAIFATMQPRQGEGSAHGQPAHSVTNRFAGHSISHTTEGQLSDYNEVLATAAGSVPDVVRLLFVPLTLSADYPMQPYRRLTEARPLAGVTLVVLWLASAIFLARKHPVAVFAMVWTLVLYLPCSNIIPLTLYFLADRYLYVPSFGVCLLVAIVLVGAPRLAALGRPGAPRDWLHPAAHVVAGLLIAAFGVRSAVRNTDWHDDYALWSSSFRAGFATWRAHDHLGCALSSDGRFSEAIEHYRAGLRLNGGASAHMQNKLGVALFQEGNIDEALHCYREATRIDPDLACAHINLGVALDKQGESEKAVSAYEKALHLDPLGFVARFNLANALRRLGKLDEAIAEYRGALEGNPDYWKARCNLGFSLYKQGKIDEAIQEYRHGLRIKPDEPHLTRGLERALTEQTHWAAVPE